MIKILHFITDTNIGGAGRLLCTQINNMNKNDFDISVALPKYSKLKTQLQKAGCKIIDMEHSADKSFSMNGIIEAYKIIKKSKPDILHSHGSLSSRIAATICCIPSRIFTRHCVFPLSFIYDYKIVKYIVGKINDYLSTGIIAVAHSAKQNLIDMGVNPHKIVTIINGVEPLKVASEDEKEYIKAKYNINKDDFIISIFARLEKYKGQKTFLQAAKICNEKYKNFRFFIVGNGTQSLEMKKLASKLNVHYIVHFTGFCNDVSSIFNITNINVNCSFGTETSSLAISEGFSLGIPCIASDYGGNTYMVKNEVEGLIFPQKNTKALAKAIIRLYENKKLYQECSLGAIHRYNNELNAKKMTEKMENFYKDQYKKNNGS